MDPSKMSVREPRVVVLPYSDVRDDIKYLLSKSPGNLPLRSKLECLEKTLCSMEPMVYDMEQSESLQASHRRHKFTEEFLSLVKEAKIPLGILLGLQGHLSKDVLIYFLKKVVNFYNLRKLKTLTKELKNLHQKYVKEELRKLADGGGEPDEMTLRRLVRYLSSTIRITSPNDYTSIPVLRNMVIILDSLQQESDKRAQLFVLLKEVKLLLRFRNGDHGLDILNLLLIRERELRKHFVTKGVLARLKNLDQQDAYLQRQKMGQTWFMLIVSAIAIAGSCPPKSFIYFLIIAFAALQFFKALSELINGPSSNTTNSNGRKNLTRKNYDIFLNFRGSGIRYPLAGVLCSNLEKANFNTFFNEMSVQKSEKYVDAIKHAIGTSIGAIIIFSKSYSESEYCLDELVLILERVKMHKGYTIIPIFYDLEPRDLTKPESRFGLGLRKHHNKVDKIRLENWKEALAYVACISGILYHSNRDYMDELVDKVVKVFKNHMRRSEGHRG